MFGYFWVIFGKPIQDILFIKRRQFKLQHTRYIDVHTEIIMTIRCFLLSATVYVITVCLLYTVNINAKDVESFQTEGSTRAIRSLSTSDFHCKSLLICAQTCLSNRQCCVVSFSKETSTCRLDISEKCCIDTETKDGWRTIRRKNYRKLKVFPR